VPINDSIRAKRRHLQLGDWMDTQGQVGASGDGSGLALGS
jgi:hypothetical protein